MKTLNQKLINSALAVQFVSNCPSVELARPEVTGALRVAYASNLMAIELSELDT